MKIGIICYPSIGGSGIVATLLGQALASRGHEAHFISYEMPVKLDVDEKNIFFHSVDIFPYDLFRYPDYALPLAVKISEVAKEKQLDILHAHYAIPHATSTFLAKEILGPNAPKTITTLHGTDITLVGRDPAYFEIVKFSIHRSDAVTTVSQGLREETCQIFGIEKEIQVIYNFFDPDPHIKENAFPKEQFAKPGEKLLMHASNFRGVKRVEDVVEVFRKVQKSVPCKLLLVGTGPGIEDIRSLVSSLGLEQSVHFVTNSKHIDPYLACADLFLLPSSHESFGLAALEAQCYGVPVIASNVCGLPEVISHGESGYLAEVGNTKAMASYALQLLTDDFLYTQMSNRAKELAQERFSSERIVQQYIDLYTNFDK